MLIEHDGVPPLDESAAEGYCFGKPFTAAVFARVRAERESSYGYPPFGKEVDDSNEKYTMRIWLVRIGFGGAEYKTDRRILMENLSGHSAFRNDEEKAKWMERQKAKREAARAAEHSEEEQNNAVSE